VRKAARAYQQGSLAAHRGHWAEAAVGYDAAREIDSENHLYWFYDSALRLQIGDMEGYRRNCREMVKRWDHEKSPIFSDRIAKTCSLAPDSGIEREIILKHARVASRDGNLWGKLALGLALYRTTQFDSAAEVLRELDSDELNRPAHSACLAVLAMAQTRGGDVTVGRRRLAEAKNFNETHSPKSADGEPRYDSHNWYDWLVSQLLCREAQAVLDAEGK
jgi:hypothetical protein